MTLTQVFVSNLQHSVGGTEISAETVSLSFATIKWEYFEPDTPGKVASVGSTIWDLTKVAAQ